MYGRTVRGLRCASPSGHRGTSRWRSRSTAMAPLPRLSTCRCGAFRVYTLRCAQPDVRSTLSSLQRLALTCSAEPQKRGYAAIIASSVSWSAKGRTSPRRAATSEHPVRTLSAFLDVLPPRQPRVSFVDGTRVETLSLPSGATYDIEVSVPGARSLRRAVTVDAGDDEIDVEFELPTGRLVQVEVDVESPAEEPDSFGMLATLLRGFVVVTDPDARHFAGVHSADCGPGCDHSLHVTAPRGWPVFPDGRIDHPIRKLWLPDWCDRVFVDLWRDQRTPEAGLQPRVVPVPPGSSSLVLPIRTTVDVDTFEVEFRLGLVSGDSPPTGTRVHVRSIEDPAPGGLRWAGVLTTTIGPDGRGRMRLPRGRYAVRPDMRLSPDHGQVFDVVGSGVDPVLVTVALW